jgi:tetratricopeptide (TPR) repeat protein
VSRPINPYIAGAPLRQERGFFGRQDSMEWAHRELLNPATNALVLFGQWRIGKTSLLLQLKRWLPAQDFLAVYFDLQDQATRSLGQVLADIAEVTGDRVGLPQPDRSDFDDQGRYFRRKFLPDLYAALPNGRRPVFLLDEFDVLDQITEAELSESATARTLFPLLRRIMTEDSTPAYVFVVGRRAEDLSLDFSATFKSSLVRELWVLDESSAEALIRQAEQEGSLKFTPEGVERIYRLTSGHPYLTQLLCQRIWEAAYQRTPAPSSPPLVTLAEVEASIESALEAGGLVLDWLWRGLSPAERIYAAALAETAEEEASIPEERIIEILAANAARLRTREVELAPRDLIRRHVITLRGERSYGFSVEMFRRWVRLNKPLHDVKDEIDRVEPLAESLFNIGEGFFRVGQWEQAIRYYRDSLQTNPRHFRAHLHLGEALLEMGQLEEANQELERAYSLDIDEARLPLARAHLALGRHYEENGDEELALDLYRQALQISPRESQALERIAEISKRRGDRALKAGDLEGAQKAYEQANDQEGLAKVREQQLSRVLVELEGRARQLTETNSWEEARQVYSQLLEQAPQSEKAAQWRVELELIETRKIAGLQSQAQELERQGRWDQAVEAYKELARLEGPEKWQAALERAAEGPENTRLFSEGAAAVQAGDWERARGLLATLVRRQPEYAQDGVLAVSILQQALLASGGGQAGNETARRSEQVRRVKPVFPPAMISDLEPEKGAKTSLTGRLAGIWQRRAGVLAGVQVREAANGEPESARQVKPVFPPEALAEAEPEEKVQTTRAGRLAEVRQRRQAYMVAGALLGYIVFLFLGSLIFDNYSWMFDRNDLPFLLATLGLCVWAGLELRSLIQPGTRLKAWTAGGLTVLFSGLFGYLAVHLLTLVPNDDLIYIFSFGLGRWGILVILLYAWTGWHIWGQLTGSARRRALGR